MYFLWACTLQYVRRCRTACSRCSESQCRLPSVPSNHSPVHSTCLTSRRARRRRPGLPATTPAPPLRSTYDRPTTRPSSRSSASTDGLRSTTFTTTTTVRCVRNLSGDRLCSASAYLAMQSAVLAIGMINPSVCRSVWPSDTGWYCVETTQATIMGSSLQDSPVTLVSNAI